MNLDQLARQATGELLDATGPDVVGRRAALGRRQRQRALGRAGAWVGAAALVTVAVLVGTPWGDRDVQPAEPDVPPRNGALVTVDSSGTVVVLDGELPATAPRRVYPSSSVDFTSNGVRVMVQEPDGSLALIDLRTGEATSLGACSTPGCDADLSPAGDVVALVAREGDPRIELRPVGDGPVEHLSTPGTDIHSPVWSPDGSRLAYVAEEGLFVVGRDGSDPRLLLPSLTDGLLMVGPSWSPDGSRLAFAQPQARAGEGSEPPGLVGHRFVLTVLDSESGTPQLTRDVGSCYCLGIAAPEAVWSPDGELIAVNAVRNGSRDRVDAARADGVYVVRPDGSGWRLISSTAVSAGLSWQPLVE